MIYIGNHLSTSDGFMGMGKNESALGGDTFAFFTRNPRGGKAKDIDPEDAKALCEYLKEHKFGKLVAHAPYTMNLCSDKADIRAFALNNFIDDLKRMEYVPGNYYNFHPGSHVGQGAEAGINMIIDSLNAALTEDMTTTVLLEAMAGKGSEIGSSFNELKKIIDGVKLNDKLGVTLDTCHIYDAGYDIVNDLDGVLKEFDEIIGLHRLKAIHINDSKNPFNSHKDRHECIGKGFLGVDALKKVVTHPALQGLPFILETPNDDAGYAEEIKLIRSWMV